MSAVDWNAFPPMLDAYDLALIYKRRVGGVRKGLQRRSPKLPTPCQSRPYRVRRADCKRHYERCSA